ncbi:hypothetical protein ACIBH1_14155 [Nonomuraea sp. NPDC050663]|uniref:hypothetical protein n=1 Tax=Nonomuraea sp. NPDC050663 TaxID=3364370 RepID=UPI0037AF5D1F
MPPLAAAELLESVGLAERHASMLPAQLSGGHRQRAALANRRPAPAGPSLWSRARRAIVVEPRPPDHRCGAAPAGPSLWSRAC